MKNKHFTYSNFNPYFYFSICSIIPFLLYLLLVIYIYDKYIKSGLPLVSLSTLFGDTLSLSHTHTHTYSPFLFPKGRGGNVVWQHTLTVAIERGETNDTHTYTLSDSVTLLIGRRRRQMTQIHGDICLLAGGTWWQAVTFSYLLATLGDMEWHHSIGPKFYNCKLSSNKEYTRGLK